MNLCARVFPFFVAVVYAFISAGCATTSTSSADTSSQITADPGRVLRVGVAPTSPPLIFKESGDFRGIEADLARRFAASIHKEVQFVDTPWNDLIPGLVSGKFDIIMSGMSMTKARMMRVDFTKPYMQAGQTALIRRTDLTRLRFELRSHKTKVGAQKGTTGEFFTQQNFSQSPRKYYSSAAAGANAVKKEQIDAFICDAPINWWLASENEAAGLTVMPGYMTEEYLAWGVRKGDAEMANAANQFIEAIRANGQLADLFRTWVPFQ